MDIEKVIFNIPAANLRIQTNMPLKKGGNHRKRHCHFETEIIKVTDGEITAITDRGEINLKKGESIFIWGGVMHYIMSQTEISSIVMIQVMINNGNVYNEVLLSLITAGVSEGTFKAAPDSEISGLIDDITKEAKEKQNCYELFINANMLKITAILSRDNILPDCSKITGSRGFEKIIPIIEYVDANYMQKITLQQAADIVGVDRFYFCKLFKSVCQTTFTQYLNMFRLSVAENLLRENNNVTTASYIAGFTNSQYFNRCFKERYGCSPSEYRKMFLTDKNALLT